MSIKPTLRRNFGKIASETPYNEGWVSAIKYVIPQREREFDRGVWLFDMRHYAAALAITKHYFGNNILDSTGGVSEPQSGAWKEKFDVYLSAEAVINKEYAKHKQAPRQPRAEAFNPRATLFVTKEAPKEVIVAAYRVLSSIHHPDKGGNAETMTRINAAFQQLKKQGVV